MNHDGPIFSFYCKFSETKVSLSLLFSFVKIFPAYFYRVTPDAEPETMVTVRGVGISFPAGERSGISVLAGEPSKMTGIHGESVPMVRADNQALFILSKNLTSRFPGVRGPRDRGMGPGAVAGRPGSWHGTGI
jgi:hypothetical protein